MGTVSAVTAPRNSQQSTTSLKALLVFFNGTAPFESLQALAPGSSAKLDYPFVLPRVAPAPGLAYFLNNSADLFDERQPEWWRNNDAVGYGDGVNSTFYCKAASMKPQVRCGVSAKPFFAACAAEYDWRVGSGYYLYIAWGTPYVNGVAPLVQSNGVSRCAPVTITLVEGN